MTITEQNLQELEARAEALVERYRRAEKEDREIRPVAVEFAGSPKAGKTTAIEAVQHFFHRLDFRVWAPTEGASKRTPSYLRQDLVAFNTWGLSYAISELLIAHHSRDRPHLLILDRGLYDALAWMKLLRDEPDVFKKKVHRLSEEEYKTIHDFALNGRWRELISCVYVFTADPDTSMGREHRAKLTQRGGTAMNPAVLEAIRKRYLELGEEIQALGTPFKPIDTTGSTTPLPVAYEVADDILNMLERSVESATLPQDG